MSWKSVAIPVAYEAVRISTGFHADLLVEDCVIIEVQAAESVAPVHKKQLLTYLKLTDNVWDFSSTSMWF